MEQRLTVGVLAHVDAGKTTLGEAFLYLSGAIRTPGRVDRGNTSLDTDPQERERGITILAKQTRFTRKNREFILLDTPGHVDFAAETERVLDVLDCAVLVISATDGVQNHTRTLWKLLRERGIPTFLFVNKTDLPNSGEQALAAALARDLDTRIFPCFTGESGEKRAERMALVSDSLLEAYTEAGTLTDADIGQCIAECGAFPVFFGAALRFCGVEPLMDALCDWMPVPQFGADFSARVFRITYDRATPESSGTRLTWVRLFGGELRVRSELVYRKPDGEISKEKIAALRRYTGEKFTQIDRAEAGDVCAVVGLSATVAGQGLGALSDALPPRLQPVLSRRLLLPTDCDPRAFFSRLRELEEEDPTLHLSWEEEHREIRLLLMGEVQTEVLTRRISDRFGVKTSLDEGSVLYRETVAAPVEGVGHYEPLRHYAEVHLLIEPLPPGCGILFDTRCSENALARNWQRLILSHLGEKEHKGVLIGAPLTDVRITLLSGRAHIKHTEGGDFREATWRAVRQGLMNARNILLEPMYAYRLTLPTEAVGQAMTDLDRRHATVTPETCPDEAGKTVLTGRVPVAAFLDFPRQMAAYTHGEGQLSYLPDGYAPCQNQEEVIAAAGYDPESDLQNPASSVFCAHGAGFFVPWDQVPRYMHLESGLEAALSRDENAETLLPPPRIYERTYDVDEGELEAIMLREFGPMKRRTYREPVRRGVPEEKEKKRTAGKAHTKDSILLVDGYNLIFAWEPLAKLAESSLEHARSVLEETLSSYVGYTGVRLTLVYDAYLVKDGVERTYEKDGYTICFTAENVTADSFIERQMCRLGPNLGVRVVSSDKLIQFSAVTSGVVRTSAREFAEEITRIGAEISSFCARRKVEKQ